MFEIFYVFDNTPYSKKVFLLKDEDNEIGIFTEPEALNLYYAGAISHAPERNLTPNYPTIFPKKILDTTGVPTTKYSSRVELKVAISRVLSSAWQQGLKINEDSLKAALLR